MIVGNGDIAKALKVIDSDDILFFASGVSNSREAREIEFARESELLGKYEGTKKHLVYFSTLSIYYGVDSPYIRHKKIMEEIVSMFFSSYTLVRIGNITWGNNPNTIINYFKSCIVNNVPFEVKEEYRFLLSHKEFIYWMQKVRVGAVEEMNITGAMTWVPDLVKNLRT